MPDVFSLMEKEQSHNRPGHQPHPRIHNHLDVERCDVIGDVHGCYDELAELLVTLGHEDLLDPEIPPAGSDRKPSVIFVGDIVDRGDKIVQSLSLVHRLCRRGHALAVVGNHDDRFLRWLSGRKVQIRHGLEQTVDEFRALKKREQREWGKELIDFFSALPWALRIDEGRAIVAHAAWHAELHDEPSFDKLRSYTLYGPTTGRTTPEGFPERIDWAPDYHGPELVIFGHQVYDAPYLHEHAIGIDTGCVFGGALTALRYPTLEIVSVKSRRARYTRGGKKV
jgi:diadenosine tetraphosphatase ApaH/serine/threonine PP2A family protein phosphatase